MECVCVFCRRSYEGTPFYGCCSRCYQSSAEVRAVVDEAHPQTDSRTVVLDSEVRQ